MGVWAENYPRGTYRYLSPLSPDREGYTFLTRTLHIQNTTSCPEIWANSHDLPPHSPPILRPKMEAWMKVVRVSAVPGSPPPRILGFKPNVIVMPHIIVSGAQSINLGPRHQATTHVCNTYRVVHLHIINHHATRADQGAEVFVGLRVWCVEMDKVSAAACNPPRRTRRVRFLPHQHYYVDGSTWIFWESDRVASIASRVPGQSRTNQENYWSPQSYVCRMQSFNC